MPVLQRAVGSTLLYVTRRMTSEVGSVAHKIRENLERAFAPSHLEVINESHMHNVLRGSETHFKVVVVSSTFQALPLIKRHRLVNAALADELAAGVHALSILNEGRLYMFGMIQTSQGETPCASETVIRLRESFQVVILPSSLYLLYVDSEIA